MRLYRLLVSLVVFSCLIISVPVIFAELEVSGIGIEQFTGELLVTLPDGTELILEAGLPVPPIPSGAVIEVISGTAVLNVMGVKVEVAAGSAVRVYQVREQLGRFNIVVLKGRADLFVGLLKATLDEGDDIIVRFDIRTGRFRIIVRSGEIEIDDDGVVTVVGAGDSFEAPLPFFPEVPAEPEPPEPEPIEASPFML